MVNLALRLAALAAAALGAVAPSPGAAPARQDRALTLTFGVYTSEKPTAMYKMFSPVVKVLTAELERRLARPVSVQLTIHKSYDETIDALVEGKVDFVRVGPASYILMKERNPGVQLLAMEEEGGERIVKGVIIVAKKSPARTLADLKGKSFAFGDENSTIGRYLAQAELLKAGVKASDLGRYEYLGRHDKVAKAVELGDFDAGAIHVNTFKSSNTNDALRVIATFDNLPKPWVGRAGLGADVSDALRASMLEIKDPEILKELKGSGFGAATDAEFEFVRKGMQQAKDFQDAPPKLAPSVDKAAGKSRG